MAQTFDIRFARSEGLAGLLEAPANPYRWKGTGRLSVDAKGISIAVRRGVLSVFVRPKSCRIAAANLLEVYREGDALRLAFSTRNSSRHVLPFWVTDRDAAAEIVRLLPTQHTVELEDSHSDPGRKFILDRRLAGSLLTSAVLMGGAALVLPRYFSQSTSVEQSRGAAADLDLSPTVELDDAIPSADKLGHLSINPNTHVRISRQQAPATGTSSIVSQNSPTQSTIATSASSRLNASQGTATADGPLSAVGSRASPAGGTSMPPPASNYAAARSQLNTFLNIADRLRTSYVNTVDSPSASHLIGLEQEWWNVTSRLHNSWLLEDPALMNLLMLELAVSQNWRRLLASHAQLLATGYAELIPHEELEFVDTLVDRLRQYELPGAP